MTRLSHYAKHLLHRQCSLCREIGFAYGYHAAAVEAEARERNIIALLQQGVDPWHLEQSIRQRIAESEAA